MNLVTASHGAHAAASVASPSEPASPERDFLDTCVSLEIPDRVREAARAYGVRLGGPAVTAADWARFADEWIEAMVYWDEPLERVRLAEVLGGVLEMVEPADALVGTRMGHLVERLFARWAQEPTCPVERASALSTMLDLVDGVVRACAGPALGPADLRGLLAAVEPPPNGLGVHDARRWMDEDDQALFTQALAAGAGGLHTSADNRLELINHVLAPWRPGGHVFSQMLRLVDALGGVYLSDAVRLELLDRLTSDVEHAQEDLDACVWLVGGNRQDFPASMANVLRAAAPLLTERGDRLVRALAGTAQRRDEDLHLLTAELAQAADGWPRALAVEMGCAFASAFRVAVMDDTQFVIWLEVTALDEASPGEPGSQEAVMLGVRAARDPMVVWDAPGFTPADRIALLERIYAQDRLFLGPLGALCLERTLEAEATPAQRRALLLALFSRAQDHLPPEACSQVRLVLSREMAGMDAQERQASIEAIAAIMRTWGGWTLPLRQAHDMDPALQGWRHETLAWHERVRLELAGPPGTLEHPEVAARLEDFLRDLMEQLAQALTRWEQAAALVQPAFGWGVVEAEEI